MTHVLVGGEHLRRGKRKDKKAVARNKMGEQLYSKHSCEYEMHVFSNSLLLESKTAKLSMLP